MPVKGMPVLESFCSNNLKRILVYPVTRNNIIIFYMDEHLLTFDGFNVSTFMYGN